MATLRDFAPGHQFINTLGSAALGLPGTVPASVTDISPGVTEDQVAKEQLVKKVEADSMGQIERGYTSGRISDRANWLANQEAAAAAMGDTAKATSLRNEITGLQREAAFYAPREQDVTDLGWNPGRIVDWAGGAVGSMAASVQDGLMSGAALRGAAAVTGFIPHPIAQGASKLLSGASIAVPFATNYLSNAGETYNSMANDKDLMARTTAGERFATGAGAGAVMGALDTFGDVSLLRRGLGGTMGSKAVDKMLDGGGLMARTGRDSLIEGVTEVAQTGVQKGAHSLLNPNRDTSGDVGEYINSFAQAAVGGAPMSAAGNAVQSVRETLANRLGEQADKDAGSKKGDEIDLRTGKRVDGTDASGEDILRAAAAAPTHKFTAEQQARRDLLDGHFEVPDDPTELMVKTHERLTALGEELTRRGADPKAQQIIADLEAVDVSDPLANEHPAMKAAADFVRPYAGMSEEQLAKAMKAAGKKRKLSTYEPADNRDLGEVGPDVTGVDTSKMAPADRKKFAEQRKVQEEIEVNGKNAAGLLEYGYFGGPTEGKRAPVAIRNKLREAGQAIASMAHIAGDPTPGELFRAERLGRVVGSLLSGATQVTLEQIGRSTKAQGTPLFSAMLGAATRASGQLTREVAQQEKLSRDTAAEQVVSLIPKAKLTELLNKGVNLQGDENTRHYMLDGLESYFEDGDGPFTEAKLTAMLGKETLGKLKGLFDSPIQARFDATSTIDDRGGADVDDDEKIVESDSTEGKGEEGSDFEKSTAEKSLDKLPPETMVFSHGRKDAATSAENFFSPNAEGRLPALVDLETLLHTRDEAMHTAKAQKWLDKLEARTGVKVAAGSRMHMILAHASRGVAALRSDRAGAGRYDVKPVSAKDLMDRLGFGKKAGDKDRRVGKMLEYLKQDGDESAAAALKTFQRMQVLGNADRQLTEALKADVEANPARQSSPMDGKPPALADAHVAALKAVLDALPNANAAARDAAAATVGPSKPMASSQGKTHNNLRVFRDTLRKHIAPSLRDRFDEVYQKGDLVAVHKLVQRSLEDTRANLNKAYPNIEAAADDYFASRYVVVAEQTTDRDALVLDRATFKEMADHGKQILKMREAKDPRFLHEEGMIYFRGKDGKEVAIKGRDLAKWVWAAENALTSTEERSGNGSANKQTADYLAALSQGLAALLVEGYATVPGRNDPAVGPTKDGGPPVFWVKDARGNLDPFKNDARAPVLDGKEQKVGANGEGLNQVVSGLPESLMLDGRTVKQWRASRAYGQKMRDAEHDAHVRLKREIDAQDQRDRDLAHDPRDDDVKRGGEMHESEEAAAAAAEKYDESTEDFWTVLDDTTGANRDVDERESAKRQNAVREAAQDPLPKALNKHSAYTYANKIAESLWRDYLIDPVSGMRRILSYQNETEREGGQPWYVAPLAALLSTRNLKNVAKTSAEDHAALMGLRSWVADVTLSMQVNQKISDANLTRMVGWLSPEPVPYKERLVVLKRLATQSRNEGRFVPGGVAEDKRVATPKADAATESAGLAAVADEAPAQHRAKEAAKLDGAAGPKSDAPIQVREHKGSGYAARTRENANAAGATVAIAADFTTPGERLTAKEAGKRLLQIDIGGDWRETAKQLAAHMRKMNTTTLNVAGNGIYTLAGHGFDQARVNKIVHDILATANKIWPITGIVSGGQTGVDIAGAVAAKVLGIPATITLPKGYRQRGVDGVDVDHTRAQIGAQILDGAKALGWVPPVGTQAKPERAAAPVQAKPVNVWYGSGENAELSNLTARPFEAGGRKYLSVEHAYQSWKSGKFDQATYDKYQMAGRKIIGTLGTKTANDWNVRLMERLVKLSFEQNPEAAQKLLATGDAPITHTQDAGVWKTEFPRILEKVRSELANKPAVAQAALPASLAQTVKDDAAKDSWNEKPADRKLSTYEPGAEQTDSPKFRRWFGLSKVVDADGKPLVVYHGTDRDFSEFSRKAAQRLAIKLPGFYFTPDPNVASDFAGEGDGAVVKPVYLSLQNPLEIDMSDFRVDRSSSDLEVYNDFDEQSIPYLRDQLIDAMVAGHDGAIIRGWNDGSGDVQYVAFKPTQIKSATGNNGDFSPTNPDIRYSTYEPGTDKQAQERPDPLTQPAPSDADLEAVRAHLVRMLGDKIKVVFEKAFDAAGEWIEADKTIKLAISSIMPMLSTANHEALHAFFSGVLKNHPEARELLLKVANDPRNLDRIEAILAKGKDGNKAAIASMRASPEEALAYTFQFWGEGMLRIDSKPHGFFQKVQRFLREVLGLVRDSEKALDIFQALYDGKLAEPSAAQKAIDGIMASGERGKQWRMKRDKQVEGLRSIVFTSHHMTRNSESATMRDIATRFFTNAGSVKLGTEPGILNRRDTAGKKWLNEFELLLEGLSKEDIAEMAKWDNEHKWEDHPDPALNKRLKALYALTHRFRQEYLLPAGVELGMRDVQQKPDGGEDNRYTPMIWDVQVLLGEKDKFFAMLKQDKYKPVMDKMLATMRQVKPDAEVDTVIEAIHQLLVDRAGVEDAGKLDAQREDGVLSPFFASENVRKLDWIAQEDRGPFLVTDLVHKMSSYFHQGVRAAEYVRTWGPGGKMLKDMLVREGDVIGYDAKGAPILAEEDGPYMRELREAAAKQKVPADKVEGWVQRRYSDETRALGAMEGTLGKDISENLRKLNSGLMAYQHVRLLPLVIFASMLDPNNILVSGGKLDDMIYAYVRGMKSVWRTWKDLATGTELMPEKDRDALNAMAIGAIDNSVYLERKGEVQASEYLTGAAHKFNSKFFLYNGLTIWDRQMRISATRAGMKFIERNLKGTDSDSERKLKALGLAADQVVMDKDGSLVVDPKVLAVQRARELAGEGWAKATPEQRKQWATNQLAKAREDIAPVQEAVKRFVQRSVLSPNSAQRPAWGSDPHYAAMFHLKSFTYSFQETILTHAREEMEAGNYRPGIQLLAGVPIMIAADITKALITGGGSLPGYMANWGVVDWVLHGIGRAGMGGIGEIGMNALEDPFSLLGPSAEQVVDTVKDPGTRFGNLDMIPLVRMFKPGLSADMFDHADW